MPARPSTPTRWCSKASCRTFDPIILPFAGLLGCTSIACTIEDGQADLEPPPGDLIARDLVDRDHFDLAGAFRKGAAHDLMIDHQVADRHAVDETPEEVRFREAHDVTLANLRGAAGEQVRRMGKIFGVLAQCDIKASMSRALYATSCRRTTSCGSIELMAVVILAPSRNCHNFRL